MLAATTINIQLIAVQSGVGCHPKTTPTQHPRATSADVDQLPDQRPRNKRIHIPIPTPAASPANPSISPSLQSPSGLSIAGKPRISGHTRGSANPNTVTGKNSLAGTGFLSD